MVRPARTRSIDWRRRRWDVWTNAGMTGHETIQRSGNSGIIVDVIKLGKKGQVSLPAAVLRKLGLQGRARLLVEATDDGAVILRPAGVYPIELYSDARIKQFERADRLSPEYAKRAMRTPGFAPLRKKRQGMRAG
jgi:AbrB family looped-hinge helix DNA binding protein